MMSEYFSGWVLLGADGKPVMRNDGSRVAFRFDAAARLADELAAAPEDSAANPRRALAPSTPCRASNVAAISCWWGWF